MAEAIAIKRPDSTSFSTRPLIVDLDGTLIRSDLLIETVFSEIGRDPLSVFGMFSALARGKAALKHRMAAANAFDASTLPYDGAVLDRVREALHSGRPVYLVSASNQLLVAAVAKHLGLFTGWFASDETNNLAGDTKARFLVEEFGERGFDYIGNDATDLAVWARAAKAITARAPAQVVRRLVRSGTDVELLSAERPTWRTWIKLLRVQQYAKNALIFVPILTAHQFFIGSVINALLAFVAFSLCASSVYVLNDLADLQSDRTHPSKRFRPLASGAVPLIQGIYAVPVLFGLSVLVSTAVSLAFSAVMLGYFGLTTVYSFVLKRKMLVDVLALSMLYVIRVIAGAVAIGVVVSEWLLAFSLFIFASLSVINR
jgi:phosphoserine phosphatase